MPHTGTLPEGITPEGRRLNACPVEVIEPWVFLGLRQWGRWRTFGALPFGLPVEQQENRLIEAFQMWQEEAELIHMHDAEKARARAERKAKRR